MTQNKMPPLQQLIKACSVLMSDTLGEGSTREIANCGLTCYEQLSDESKLEFFQMLRQDFAVDEYQLQSAIREWEKTRQANDLTNIFQAAEPPRQQLLRQLNHAPGATLRIVMMRADLRRLARAEPSLKILDTDFKHLLTSWFNPGFLSMREVKWGSSKKLEQFIVDHERVHPIADISELRKRMAPRDRRVYAFFHPATGDAPLIFVEVALTQGVPETIESILENDKAVHPNAADTAVFYSINNSFEGLAGISFGSFLIKRVIEDVRSRLPQLEMFMTFSPIPGFRSWLTDTSSGSRWRQARADLYADLCQWSQTLESLPDGGGSNFPVTESNLSKRFEAMVAHYLVTEKRTDGRPLDPVARFHLGNGASVWQINWPGSHMDHSIENSFGAMVNYRYDPEKLEGNHEHFVRSGRIDMSEQIESVVARMEGPR